MLGSELLPLLFLAAVKTLKSKQPPEEFLLSRFRNCQFF